MPILKILQTYKYEGIQFMYETDPFLSEWDKEMHTDKFSCDLRKYVWGKEQDQSRYELICHTIILDGYPCSGHENGPYYNDMSDTPTGRKIIEEMKSHFTI